MPVAGSAGGCRPLVDLISSSVALAVIALIAGAAVFPALPVAPLLLVVLNGILGVYGANTAKSGLGSEDGMAWPVIRLLMAAVFAWSASLLTSLDGGAQLALWARLRGPRHGWPGAQRAAARTPRPSRALGPGR